jgi:hypothetical protein
MSRPELPQLVNDEIGFLFENPMPAFLDNVAVGAGGDRFGAIDAVIPKRPAPAPSQHWRRKFVARQLLCLFSHLWNVTVVIQAGAKIPWLAHLHDIELNFFFRHRVWVVREISEEVSKVMILSPFH